MLKFLRILLFLLSTNAFCQIKINNLFVNSTSNISKLNFSTNPPSLSYTNVGSGGIIGEGIAHAEDVEGNIVIWVNSNGVYDKNNTLMPGSTGIFADPSSTEIDICPFPNDKNKYYVFYNKQNCSPLFYSIVDLTKRNGLGDVTNINLPLDDINNYAEGLEIVKNPCKNEYWLLSYQCFKAFKCFKIDGSGISLSSSFDYVSDKNLGQGELDYHKGKMGYAMAFNNQAFVCDFDPLSGIISNGKTLSFNSINGMYGLEFSPDASKVYFTDWYAHDDLDIDAPFNLFRYDFKSGIINSYDKIKYNTTNCKGNKVEGLGQIELGKDGKLYIPHFNGCQISVIENANDLDPVFKLIDVNTTLSSGISDPIQSSIFQAIQFTADKNNICSGETVKLSASGGSGYVWKTSGKIIPNNNTELFVNPQQTTLYTLLASNQFGCTDSLQIELKVFSNNSAVIVFNEIARTCTANSIRLNVDKGLGPYQWSKDNININGANNDSLLIFEPGEYNVSFSGTACLQAPKSIIIPAEVLNKKVLYVPNLITPNGDGVNDQFMIINDNNQGIRKEGEKYRLYPGVIKITIYNRWGKIVYANENYQNDWKAEGLSTGIYYYHLSHNENCFKPQTGWLQVLE